MPVRRRVRDLAEDLEDVETPAGQRPLKKYRTHDAMLEEEKHRRVQTMGDNMQDHVPAEERDVEDMVSENAVGGWWKPEVPCSSGYRFKDTMGSGNRAKYEACLEAHFQYLHNGLKSLTMGQAMIWREVRAQHHMHTERQVIMMGRIEMLQDSLVKLTQSLDGLTRKKSNGALLGNQAKQVIRDHGLWQDDGDEDAAYESKLENIAVSLLDSESVDQADMQYGQYLKDTVSGLRSKVSKLRGDCKTDTKKELKKMVMKLQGAKKVQTQPGSDFFFPDLEDADVMKVVSAIMKTKYAVVNAKDLEDDLLIAHLKITVDALVSAAKEGDIDLQTDTWAAHDGSRNKSDGSPVKAADMYWQENRLAEARKRANGEEGEEDADES